MRRLTARRSVLWSEVRSEKEKLSRKKRGATGYTGKREVGNPAPLTKAEWIEL